MKSPRACWLMVSVLLVPAVNRAGQAPPPPKAVDPPSIQQSTATAKAAIENLAQRQRESTLAAMQASVDKQHASVSAGIAGSVGKQAQAPRPSFFSLPPMAPPPANDTVSFALPEATIADVDCLPVPDAQIAPLLLDAAQREGLEPKLLTAVIQQESAFRPCAISQKGAQGLMQLMPETAEKFGVQDPFDAKQNVDAGAKYLKELLTRYGGNLALALGAYNAGPGRVDEAGGIPAIPETTNYVNEILGRLGLKPPAAVTPISPEPPTAPSK